MDEGDCAIYSTHDNKIYALDCVELEATDWEEYIEPKKTLWDKKTNKLIQHYVSSFDISVFYESDVKEAIKEFVNELNEEWSCGNINYFQEITDILKNNFGKELVE